MGVRDFGSIGGVGHHHAGPAVLQAVGDGDGSERGEKRDVDRAQASDGEHRDQQLGHPGQEHGNGVPVPYAELLKHAGEARRLLPQLAE